jgi:hypothetical protein
MWNEEERRESEEKERGGAVERGECERAPRHGRQVSDWLASWLAGWLGEEEEEEEEEEWSCSAKTERGRG